MNRFVITCVLLLICGCGRNSSVDNASAPIAKDGAKDKFVEVSSELSRLTEEVSQLREKLSVEKRILSRALEVIEKNKDKEDGFEVTIGGSKFSLLRVRTDVNNRINSMELMQKEITEKEKQIAEKKGAKSDLLKKDSEEYKKLLNIPSDTDLLKRGRSILGAPTTSTE